MNLAWVCQLIIYPAIENNATYIRVGSKIFGERKKEIFK